MQEFPCPFVKSALRLAYPFIPQSIPQEFFIVKYGLVSDILLYPIIKTA